MGKIVSDFEQITFPTAFWNGLCLKTEVWLYFFMRTCDLDTFFNKFYAIISTCLIPERIFFFSTIAEEMFLFWFKILFFDCANSL